MARKTKDWQRYMQIDRGLELVGMDRYDLAERLTEQTGEDWSYRMVHNLCNGKKVMDDGIIVALRRITGLPYEWFLDDPREMLGIRETIADNALSLQYEDLHPINAGVKDGHWFHRDETMHLPNPSWWDGLQSETLPIKIAS